MLQMILFIFIGYICNVERACTRALSVNRVFLQQRSTLWYTFYRYIFKNKNCFTATITVTNKTKKTRRFGQNNNNHNHYRFHTADGAWMSLTSIKFKLFSERPRLNEILQNDISIKFIFPQKIYLNFNKNFIIEGNNDLITFTG